MKLPDETVLEELRNALQLITAARTADEGRGVVEMLEAAEHRVQNAVEKLSAPARSIRPLTKRHIRGLHALTRADLSDSDLRAAIGAYATNVVKSLEDRALIARSPGGFWRITAAGMLALSATSPSARIAAHRGAA